MKTGKGESEKGGTGAQPVRIEERLLYRIGVREWGLPSMCIPGKIWRSEIHGTITCMVASDNPDRVKIETLPLIRIAVGDFSEMPDHWRAALWEYVQAWPSSGCGYGPFLKLTEEQRCGFIRKMAEELVKSDNIGCRSIANDIGEFAAYGYQLCEVDNSAAPATVIPSSPSPVFTPSKL